MDIPRSFQSQISFMYVKDLDLAVEFFMNTMHFELVDDQGWTKIFRSAGNAFLGVVSGEKAFKQPQRENAVLITLCVDDVPHWYDYLKKEGVTILREIQDRPDNQVRCFFFEGPGGYAFEIQEFLNPALKKYFHQI